jgi:CRP-like cAMP-binding protein
MASVKNARATGNHLLDRLPNAELDRLLADAEWIPFEARQEVYSSGGTNLPVYFPISGVYSLLLPMLDGQQVEVGVVDSEGMLGIPVVFGLEYNPLRAVTQVPGECVRVAPERFLAVLRTPGGVLDSLVRRFLAVSWHTANQNIACGLRHTVRQRACRWLLAVHHRAGVDEFELTQEHLSQMVGASRQKLTAVAGKLQREGLITYQRGRVRVVNRRGLEAASCECYRVLKDAYELLAS